jgi:hypothetical protein
MKPTKAEFLRAKTQCQLLIEFLSAKCAGEGFSTLAVVLLGAGAVETFCREYPEAREWLTRAATVTSPAEAQAFLDSLPDHR